MGSQNRKYNNMASTIFCNKTTKELITFNKKYVSYLYIVHIGRRARVIDDNTRRVSVLDRELEIHGPDLKNYTLTSGAYFQFLPKIYLFQSHSPF